MPTPITITDRTGMPEAVSFTVSKANTPVEAVSRELEPSIESADSETDFQTAWRRLSEEPDLQTVERDLGEYLSPSDLHEAYALALRYPEKVSITSNQLNYEEDDMTAHVRQHFNDLFNEEEVAPQLKRDHSADIPKLMKVAEITYTSDAVLQLCTKVTFYPDDDELNEIFFVNVPTEEIGVWMGRVEILWSALRGALTIKEPLDTLIDELYDERPNLIEAARDEGLFLPVQAEYAGPEERDLRPYLRARFLRGGHGEVKTERVHQWCFSRLVDMM